MRQKTLLNLDEYSEVLHEWGTVPFTSVAIVKGEQRCPVTHPALVLADVWPGLDIMCYCEPSADFSTVFKSACLDGRAGSTKCYERQAVPTLYLGVINGYKVCGERGGDPFRNSKRPIVSNKGTMVCPRDTVPCDDSVFKKTVTEEEVLADPEHPVNFLICAEQVEDCPITNFDLSYNEAADNLIISIHKRATNLPLLKFKLSEEQPCLKGSYYPGDSSNYFQDEIRKGMAKCPATKFETIVDPRYKEVTGGYSIAKEVFEE
jgi:hypothetical protein